MSCVIRVRNHDARLWVYGLIGFSELTLRTQETGHSLYIMRLTDGQKGVRSLLRAIGIELALRPVVNVVWYAHTNEVFKWSFEYATFHGVKSIDGQRFLCDDMNNRFATLAKKVRR